MPLQVWLPFLGNADNQGLLDLPKYSISNLTYTAGKLGNCSCGHIGWHLNSDILANAWSVATWYKASSFGQYNNIIFCKNIKTSDDCQIYFSIISNTTLNVGVNGPSSSYSYSFSFSTNTWYHLAATYDGSTVSLYINGAKVRYGTVTTAKPEGRLNIQIDGRSCDDNNTTSTGGVGACYNDFRLYDECISPKEVKLLSQGLVAHYQLNDPYSTSNLFPNGFGQDGALGWASNSAISTTEIPPNQPAIKASYYSGNMTTSYIPISHATDYTINMYIKATSGATGNVYPSLYPYDVDKKFIDYYKCTIGFGTAYKTTLAQPLHKGDTVIYATNLSAWTTATDNHYFHVAIFGYADSTGYVYPDMGYTADSPSFGSKTDKSNIDKTNNTITLLAPFTGEDRPAGTTICQATEGATYFYPYGGIGVSTIADWTYKTAVIDVNNTRLRFAKYVNFMSYWGAYYAGIQLIDNNANQIVYDSSGYNYHGMINTGMLSSIDTARNLTSMVFNGTDNTIKIPFNTMLGLTEAGKREYTISVWTYKTSIGSKGYQTIIGGPSGFELEARNASGADPQYVTWNWGKVVGTYEFNKWEHFCFVHTLSDSKLYVNGVLQGTGSAANVPIGDFFIGSWRDVTSQNYQGKMSDFRIYATALSADDVLNLYNAPVSVANNGAMITQGEFVEV